MTRQMTRPFPVEPAVAAAPASAWRTWLLRAVTASRPRLAAVSLLLVAALAAGAGMLWLFGFLVEQVFEGDTTVLDSNVLILLRGHHSPLADDAAALFSFMGSEAVAILLGVLLVWFLVTRRWGAAVTLVLVTGGAQLLNDVLKTYFHRPRPAPLTDPLTHAIPGQAWSFPSGHAMVAAAFYLFLAYLTWRVLSGWLQALTTTALCVLVFLIGLARLYLGVHFLTDVVAGYCAGALWTESLILAQRLITRRRPRPPDAALPAPTAIAA